MTTNARLWGKGHTYLLFVGVQTSTATVEISVKFLSRLKI